MSSISEIYAREILDSRGMPTVEVDVILDNGVIGRASVPSGASKGRYEAQEKRDEDDSRYCGQGVLGAIAGIFQEIAPLLKGQDVNCQRKIDEQLIALDGTPNKNRLGANAILGVSLAVAKAAAAARGQLLYQGVLGANSKLIMPTPFMNVINGGVHGDNRLTIQEFMLVPLETTTFRESIQKGVEVFQALKSCLKKRGFSTNVGDEGGFAPTLEVTTQAMDLLCESIQQAGFEGQMGLALDVAANEFYQKGQYHWDNIQGDSGALIDFYTRLSEGYPLICLEDALGEDDWEGWAALTQALGSRLQLVGDDLFVTNKKRVEMGVQRGVANSVLIKINQIGTLTEAFDTLNFAHQNSYRTIVSHRSGETEDTSIADLAVAWGCQQIKFGAPSRTDRTAKYNQLLRIEEMIHRT